MTEITFHHSIFEVTLSEKDIIEMYHELEWIPDAIAALLQPEKIRESWDFPFSPEEYREKLKDFMLKHQSFTIEFIDQLFNSKIS